MPWMKQQILPRETEDAAVTRTFLPREFPISHFTITLHQELAAAFDPVGIRIQLYAKIERIRVIHRGITIVNLFSEELTYLLNDIWKLTLHPTADAGDNTTVQAAISILVPFGRRMYNDAECLPQAPVGDTRLEVDMGALVTGVTTTQLAVSATYLPAANPQRHLSYQELTIPNPVLGLDNELAIPCREPIIGIHLSRFAAPTTAGTAGTIRQVSLIADDADHRLLITEFDDLWAEARYRQAIRWIDQHSLTENLAAIYTQNAESAEVRAMSGDGDMRSNRHAYIDFDPNHDDQHILDPTQFRNLALRFDVGNVSTIRVIPVLLRSL